jgi:hypothetical protein
MAIDRGVHSYFTSASVSESISLQAADDFPRRPLAGNKKYAATKRPSKQTFQYYHRYCDLLGKSAIISGYNMQSVILRQTDNMDFMLCTDRTNIHSPWNGVIIIKGIESWLSQKHLQWIASRSTSPISAFARTHRSMERLEDGSRAIGCEPIYAQATRLKL